MQWLKNLFGNPRTQFVRELSLALEEAGIEDISYDDDAFCLRFQADNRDEPEATLNLHNLFPMYNDLEPDDREEFVSRIVRSVQTEPIPKRWGEVERDIRPAIRAALQVDLHRLYNQRSGETWQIAHRPVGANLNRVLVLDREESMATLNVEHLQTWDVSFDEAFDQAVRNLAAEGKPPWHELEPGFYLSELTDDYAGGRMFIDGLFDGLQLRGVPLVFVPNRTTLLVVGSEDPEAIEKALIVSVNGTQQPNPISALPLVQVRKEQTPSGWQAWEPPEDHPVAALFEKIRRSELAGLYAQQQEILQQVVGEDVFVASYALYGDEENPTSLCTWARDLPALLPKAELVGLFDPNLPEGEQLLGGVEWTQLQMVCGHHLRRTEDVPERYKVDSFPSPDEIERLTLLRI